MSIDIGNVNNGGNNGVKRQCTFCTDQFGNVGNGRDGSGSDCGGIKSICCGTSSVTRITTLVSGHASRIAFKICKRYKHGTSWNWDARYAWPVELMRAGSPYFYFFIAFSSIRTSVHMIVAVALLCSNPLPFKSAAARCGKGGRGGAASRTAAAKYLSRIGSQLMMIPFFSQYYGLFANGIFITFTGFFVIFELFCDMCQVMNPKFITWFH